MPHFEEVQKLPASRLLVVGLPAFILSIVLSILIHEYAHVLAHRLVSGTSSTQTAGTPAVEATTGSSPVEALAGPSATLLVAVVSFALLVRFPGNLFFSSMAFVNAAGRLPETLTLCAQLFFRENATAGTDESSILTLLHFQNPTAGLVILCFYSMILMFMSVAVIHESKTVPWKWLIALGMLAVTIPAQPVLARIIGLPFI